MLKYVEINRDFNTFQHVSIYFNTFQQISTNFNKFQHDSKAGLYFNMT